MTLSAEFAREGFVIIPNALSPEVVASLNAAFTAHRTAYAPDWVDISDSMSQTVDVLNRTDQFDQAIENSQTLPLLRSALSELIGFYRGFSTFIGTSPRFSRFCVEKGRRAPRLAGFTVIFRRSSEPVPVFQQAVSHSFAESAALSNSSSDC